MAATPHIQIIQREIQARWPHLNFGLHNCRHISRKSWKPWSQHAASEPGKDYYSNAVDIHDPYDNYLSATLDQVYAYLVKNRARFHIRVVLWRTTDHYDHIHVDTWPMMKDNWWYKPPCKGGTLITINEDGTTQNTFATTEEDLETLQLGDQGNTVAKLQKGLNGWVTKFAPTLGLLTVDGDFGPATLAHVEAFQSGAEMPRYTPGIVGGVTWGALMEYVPDWIDNPTSSGLQSGDTVTIADDGLSFSLTGIITEKEN